MVTKANPASALGEAAGKLFESAIRDGLRAEVEARGHTIRAARLRNGSGNAYQVDAVIFDAHDNPIVIIDPKYIRYTKHNRDKGSWLCVAHYNLRKTYPTIRKSIAILAGRWSAPSKALIQSFGVEISEVPFSKFVESFGTFGVSFDWHEKDRTTARNSWELFEKLSDEQRNSLAVRLVEGMIDDLNQDVARVLDADIDTLPHRVSGVEVLLKTEQNEMLLLAFHSVPEALGALAAFVSDRPDIGELLRGRWVLHAPHDSRLLRLALAELGGRNGDSLGRCGRALLSTG